MNKLPDYNIDFFRSIFSFEVMFPIGLILTMIWLMYSFYKLNWSDNDIEKFIRVGGDKMNESEFAEFVRTRRLYGNSLIIISMTILFIVYGAFMIWLF